MELNNKLKELRMARGWTQAEMGECLEVNPKVISKWENGESMPQSELLPAIADAFDLTIDQLFGRDGKQPVDHKAVVRKYGFAHGEDLPAVQDVVSYAILGMQEHRNLAMGCYAPEVLAEISEELCGLIEENDPRPQCFEAGTEDFACHYCREGLGITTLVHCEADAQTAIFTEGYGAMRALFRVLALEGAERVLEYLLAAKDNLSFTFAHLMAETKTDAHTAKEALGLLDALRSTTCEQILSRRAAVIGGREVDVYTYYPGCVTNMLRNVLLAAHLLTVEKGGFR